MLEFVPVVGYRVNIRDEAVKCPSRIIIRKSPINEDGNIVQTSCNVPMCPCRMRVVSPAHPTGIGRSPDRPHVYTSRSFAKFLSLLFFEESYRAISRYVVRALSLNLFSVV